VEIIDRPSPNFDDREGASVDILLLHYTGMRTGEEAVERLCDPTAKVSAHYCLFEDGRILRLVADEKRAWHAGVSNWMGETNVNARSIGIEIVNPGHEFGYRPFPEPQIAALEVLAASLMQRFAIPPHRVLGHSDVAPLRKEDPGELFPWARFARKGIGIFPDWDELCCGIGPQAMADPLGQGADYAALQTALRAIGYEVTVTGREDETTAAALRAFQRHFLTGQLGRPADGETLAAARKLAQIVVSAGPAA
jgi:N-acetylmuramoyl-L-alanine amidase